MNDTRISYQYEQGKNGKWHLKVNNLLFSKEYNSKTEMLGALERTIKPLWYEALIDRDSFKLHVIEELLKKENDWIARLSKEELLEYAISIDNIKETEIFFRFGELWITYDFKAPLGETNCIVFRSRKEQ